MVNVPEDSLHPLSRAAWRDWLRKHHQQQTGIWLISYKKSSGKAKVSYDDIIEEALCFGWIDGPARPLDEERSMLRLSPRRKGSNWSGLNKKRVAKLLEGGLIEPAGLAKIEAAKLDGTWNALDEVEAGVIPPDLEQELAKYNQAKTNFVAFPKSVKRAILEWILGAKKSETRAKRIEETARLANQNIRANQWQPKDAKPG